ncbi:MAG: hypothetical protein FWC92_00825 [Defluviitaleaceae bacterium]|nr:hypothetical protein [Defluviitaleaceae bacterium]
METYHVGKIIRHLRKQAGVSMETLANEIMDPTNLWRIEEGHITPREKACKSCH